MMMEALDQPLTLETIEDLELGMLVVGLRDELASSNRLEDFIAFIGKIKKKQPDIYNKEYLFLDDLLVQYYLFRNETEGLREAISRCKANPVDAINISLEILEDLTYYGETEVAVELSRVSYEPVRNAPNLMGGAEADFANIIILSRMDKTYQQLRVEEEIDWDSLADEAEGYGVGDRHEWLDKAKNDLTTEVEVNDNFLKNFKKQKDRLWLLRHLGIYFSLYAKEEKQIPFITSQAIWESLINFLQEGKKSNKQLNDPNSYFRFEQKQLDRYLAPLLVNLFSAKDMKAMALLYGIPYIYDFLLSKEAIDQEVCDRAIAASSEIKAILIPALSLRLWKYNFVHRWLPPNNISEEEFAAEAELFAASINDVTPLSEEPGQRTIDSYLNAIADTNVPRELLEEFQRQTGRNPFKSAEPEPAPKLKPQKSPKSRRSPLQEAANINSNKGKKKKKK